MVCKAFNCFGKWLEFMANKIVKGACKSLSFKQQKLPNDLKK